MDITRKLGIVLVTCLCYMGVSAQDSIALDEVVVVKERYENGSVYVPKLRNGEIVWKKSGELTRLYHKKQRWMKQGLNEYGIDINGQDWVTVLRGHLGAKMIKQSGGVPILIAVTSLGFSAKGTTNADGSSAGLEYSGGGGGSIPLFVLDDVPLNAPPNARALAPMIKEIKILKHSDAAKYGIRGANGVIEIYTSEK